MNGNRVASSSGSTGAVRTKRAPLSSNHFHNCSSEAFGAYAEDRRPVIRALRRGFRQISTASRGVLSRKKAQAARKSGLLKDSRIGPKSSVAYPETPDPASSATSARVGAYSYREARRTASAIYISQRGMSGIRYLTSAH